MSKRKLESLTGLFDYGGSDEETAASGEEEEELNRTGTGVVLLHDYGDEDAEDGGEDVSNTSDEGPAPTAAGEAAGAAADGGGGEGEAVAEAAINGVAEDAAGADDREQKPDREEQLRQLLEQLPPEIVEPPLGECDPKSQERVATLIDRQRASGKKVIDEMRKNRDYRNPDFLQKMVDFFDIDELATAFPPDVFDPPHSLPKEDYYEELAKEFAAWNERRTAERQRTGPRVEFAKGGVLPGGSGAAAQGGVRPNPLQAGGGGGGGSAAAVAAVAGKPNPLLASHAAQAAQAKAQQVAAALSLKSSAALGSGGKSGGGGGGSSKPGSRWGK